MSRTHVATLATVLLCAAGAAAQPTIIASAGSDAEVTAAVNAFRAALGGGAANTNVIGSFLSGRREINWDAVPDANSAPNPFPGDFFNQPATGRARGAEFSTDGSGFMVSADADNPTSTPRNFANIDPAYLDTFRQFSPQRLFTPVDSIITEIQFFIPGQSHTRATVAAFGVVFTDVDLEGTTEVICFDRNGVKVAAVDVPASSQGQQGFSFVGILATGGERIWRIVIKTGTHALGAGVIDDPAHGVDLVVMDDFLYAEPVAATDPEIFASGGTDAEVTEAVGAFRDALGTLNPNQPGSFGTGRREINWDAVPDTFASPNALPLNFFNANSVRGAVFTTPGSHLEVSADTSNPTNTAVEFASLDPSYAGLFRTFSPQRLFTAVGSNEVTTNFLVPGSATPAFVSGFGAVFTDVDQKTSARIDWHDQAGGLLASIYVPVGSAPEESLSFLGARFPALYRVASVTIQSGSVAPALGAIESIGANADVVVMDDFIYAEPVELPAACPADLTGDGTVNSDDFFAFLTGFFQGVADFNADGVTTSQDLYDFLTSFFTGC